MKLRNLQNQTGSAIFYILIAVALFAALGFTVSNMMRGSGFSSTISAEKQGILAAEILSYAQQVRNTVKDLQISNDCEDTDISFENDNISGHIHTPPTSDECKIFHPNGGAQHWSVPNAEAFEGAVGEWRMHAGHCVRNVGSGSSNAECVSSSKELIMDIVGLKKGVCTAINESVGIANPGGSPPQENHSVTNQVFDGTFSDGQNAVGLLTTPEIDGHRAGCIQDIVGGFSGLYIFYQVILAR